jgi:hypothetical protein
MCLSQIKIPDHQIEKYMVGLDLINLHQLTLNEMNLTGYV